MRKPLPRKPLSHKLLSCNDINCPSRRRCDRFIHPGRAGSTIEFGAFKEMRRGRELCAGLIHREDTSEVTA